MPEPMKKTIRLGDLRLAAVPLDVTFGGQTIEITYRPYAMDAAFEDAFLAALQATENQLEVYAAYRTHLAEVIAGWNVTGDDDSPLPLDLKLIPGRALIDWYSAILEHLSPNQ